MSYYVDSPNHTGTPTRISNPTKTGNPTRMKLSNLYTANDPVDVTIANTTTETTIATFTIPKENISVGSVLSFSVTRSHTGSVETFMYKGYINGVACLYAVSDLIGGSSVGFETFGVGIFSSLGATGTIDIGQNLGGVTSITVDTTADVTLVIKGQWSEGTSISFTKTNASATLIG